MNSHVLRGSRLIALCSLHHTLITLAHESHQGIVSIKQRLRDLYWWPKMDSQVQSHIASCILCRANDKTAFTHPAPPQSDYYSKWPELAFSHTATTENVTHFLASVFSQHGKFSSAGLSCSCTTEGYPTTKLQSSCGQNCDMSRLPHAHNSHQPSHKLPLVKYKPKWQKCYVMY